MLVGARALHNVCRCIRALYLPYMYQYVIVHVEFSLSCLVRSYTYMPVVGAVAESAGGEAEQAREQYARDMHQLQQDVSSTCT